MNKWVVGLFAVVVLTFAGCGSSLHKLTPEEQAQVKQVEPIVKKCIETSTKAKAILNCVAPEGHSKQLEKCMFKAVFHDLPGGRLIKMRKDATICVVKNR